MKLKMMLFGLLAISMSVMTSCKKDEVDVPSIAEGDVFEFSTVRNKGDVKGWKYVENEVVAMTTEEIESVIAEEEIDAFESEEIAPEDMEAKVEFMAENRVKYTVDGDELNGTYTMDGSNLSLTITDAGFTLTFPYVAEEGAIYSRNHSFYTEGENVGLSAAGMPWAEGMEETYKSDLTEGGDLIIYQYYEMVYDKK